MKRHRHTPEQAVRKLREGDRLLAEGKDLTEVLRQLERVDMEPVAEHVWRDEGQPGETAQRTGIRASQSTIAGY